MSKDIKAVILAAGLGTRMKSDIPKALHQIQYKPLIWHILRTLKFSGLNDIICVLGYKAEMVENLLKGVEIVKQRRPLGSADALNATRPYLKNFKGHILVLYGDEPLIKPETIGRLIKAHKEKGNFCTLLTSYIENPSGYGRIVRDRSGSIVRIVEEKETSVAQKGIKEINVGVYCFKNERLFSLLGQIRNNNKKREYFLTDIISLAHKMGLKTDSVVTADDYEWLGVNSRDDLAIAERILRERKNKEIINKGVTLIDPNTVSIDEEADIGKDSIVYPYTVIEDNVRIGKNCKIGPFARIRSGCRLSDGVEIGDFVELVRTKVGRDTKIKHHAYLGDAIIGKGVNIGAGSITANYDGKAKFTTKIGDNCFIGCGTIFVAPVKVGKCATTGAGAVVIKNRNVPPRSVVVGIPARIIKKLK